MSRFFSIPKITTPKIVYTCAIVEFLTTLGTSICVVPSTRMIESAVCQRFYESNIPLAEHLCKTDGVQSEMAYLMGAMSSFGFLPGLLLSIPYGILAEHVDRRLLLLVNALSNTISMLYLVAICYYPGMNLKLLWLTGLFDIIGGGGPFFYTLTRTIIAEAVPSSSLSNLFYKLSGINLIIRLSGVAFGSWLLRNGAYSTMLTGISTYALIIPLLTFLPCTRPEKPLYLKGTEYAPLAPTEPSSREMADPTELPHPNHFKTPAKSSQSFIKEPISEPPHPKNPFKTMKSELLDSLSGFKRLVLHSSAFNMCLIVMFLHTLSLGVRGLLRPWVSKRYAWTLAETGYILSLESILSVAVLFLLQYLDTSHGKSEQAKRARELWVSKLSLLSAIAGSLMLAISGFRTFFFLSLVVISGSVGFLDAIKAYFTAQLDTQDIGRLYSTIMVVETLAMILGAPVWSELYSTGYRWGNAWQGLPWAVSAFMLFMTLILIGRLKA